MNDSSKTMLQKVEDETEKLKRLAHLLHEAGSATVFRCLQCIALTRRRAHHSSICLLFKLPGWADPEKSPLTLGNALERSSPSLTTRFSLAKALVSAVYQLHSASWMHRKISSGKILFFSRLYGSPESTTAALGAYDYRNPYLDGLKHSRATNFNSMRSGSTMSDQRLFLDFLRDIHRHPSYMLNKSLWEEPHRYHRFRHEYYSLGLVLLEIGLWLPLRDLDVAKTPEWHTLMESLETNVTGANVSTPGAGPLERLFMGTTRKQLEILPYDLRYGPSKWEAFVGSQAGSSDFSRRFIEALETAILDERMTCQSWQAVLSWEFRYPFHLFRQLAISCAERDLAATMGEKYQKLVLRCLKSDFGVQFDADESAWLHAFNWHAVREIEQCCV
jgi:hypothetical protein